MKKKKWLVVLYIRENLIDVWQKQVSAEITEDDILYPEGTIFFFFSEEAVEINIIQMVLPNKRIGGVPDLLKIISGKTLYCPGIKIGKDTLLDVGVFENFDKLLQDCSATVKFIAPY